MSDREELTRTVLRVEAERAAKDAAWSRPRTHPMQNMQPSVARLFELANYRPPAAPSVDPAWAHGRALLACLSSIATCASAQLGEWAVEKALWVVAND